MKKDTQKVATTSENIENESLQKLRTIFPQFIKDGLIDFDSLQAFFKKEGILAGPEKYGLSWAGKSKAFNDISRPSTGTLIPQIEESKNWDTTENIFIEGENLEVLKLLQKKYANPGKIKMIYIDPPYNTGKDFIYKDNFTQNVSDYYEQTGQTQNGVKLTSNPESNGRYHSDWLTMMYSRLFLARNLLKDDGVIFVSIDDNEVSNLRMIMDEIFGEENHVGVLKWKRKKQPSYLHGHLGEVMEYILVYAKTIENLEKLSIEKRSDLNTRIDNATNSVSEKLIKKGIRVKLPEDVTFIKAGLYKSKTMTTEYLSDVRIQNGRTANDVLARAQFRNDQHSIDNFVKKDVIFITRNYGFRRDLLEEEKEKRKAITDLLLDWGDNQDSDKEMQILFPEIKPFDYPKPVKLIKNLISSVFSEDEIVLDFFAGSGTTAQAVMELNLEDGGNRKCVSVQIPEELDEAKGKTPEEKKIIKERINFLISLNKPTNIAEISKERIRRAGTKINKGDIGFKAFSLASSNYRKWNTLTQEDDESALLKQAKLFLEKPLVDGYDEKSIVYEIMLKEGFDLNSYVEEPKKNQKDLPLWVVVDKGGRSPKMTISFAKKVTKEALEKTGIGETDNEMFVCFDSALDDTTKVNISRNLTVKTI